MTQFKLDTFSCRLCRSKINQKEFFPERYFNAGQTVRRCGYCSSVYLSPDFTDQGMDIFYKKTYKELFPAEYMGEKVKNFFKYRTDDYYAARRFNSIKKLIPVGGSLFEIGSGFGNFINQVGILRSDIEKYANEPDEHNRMASIDKTPISFINEDDYSLYAQYFDLVAAFHVLEHAVDPAGFIRAAKNMLKDDGYLVIEVPNLKDGCGSQKYFHTAHLSYFTENTLQNLIISIGFELIYCGPSPKDTGAADALWAICRKTGAINEHKIAPASIDEIILIDSLLNSFRWSSFDRIKEKVKKCLIFFLGVSVYGMVLRRFRFYLDKNKLRYK